MRTKYKKLLFILCLLFFSTAIFSQDLRMGIVKTIKGNNYYESVETEPHDSLLYKLLQSIEYDTIITDTFRVKRIKRVMKKDTKTLYYVYLDGPDKIYKLVTISDNADKDIIKDFKKLKTRHKYVLTLYPKHIKPDDGIPHIIAGNEELKFDVFWIPYFDFKYHLQNFYYTDNIIGLFIKQ